MNNRWITAVIGLLLLGSCPAHAIDLQFSKISGLVDVVDVRNAGDGSNRLFLVRQSGQVRVISDGLELEQPFMDLTSRLSVGGERGLLSIAFAPDFADSGYLYAWYTSEGGDTVLSRFSMSGDPNVADEASEQILLHVSQPYSNHNGGRLQFGPDGYLYLGLGDGGSGGDPQGYAQNMASLLGKLIRIDVNPAHGSYALPPDNPFLGEAGVAGEIWSAGLRNPWRISFDIVSGDLYISDVGQGGFEEVNFQSSGSAGGENYGWNEMEGSSCYREDCDQSGLTLPVSEYSHGPACSIIGGEVYRGSAYPDLYGMYLFADRCDGGIRGLSRTDGSWKTRLLADTNFASTTFGLGEDGSIYIAASGDGVYLISDGQVQDDYVFSINPGLNDVWYSPRTDGQGSSITVFPKAGTIFLAWFTFDTVSQEDGQAVLGDPGHRWLTAQGDWQGNLASLRIYVTRGGLFNKNTPSPETGEPIGTATLEFHDCENATLNFEIPDLALEDSIRLKRVVADNVEICIALGGS